MSGRCSVTATHTTLCLRFCLGGSALDLFPRHRPDVGYFPTNAGERFYGSNDPDHNESEMDNHPDQTPENGQDGTESRHAGEDGMNDREDDANEEPGTAQDDRLHGVEANKAIPFFQDVENDATNEWNAR